MSSGRDYQTFLKYALKHDWLLQEDFYTVDNIRHLLGVSEVYVVCIEAKQFLPAFRAYGAIYRARTAYPPVDPLPDVGSLDGFYNKNGGVSTGGLRHLEDGRLSGIMHMTFVQPPMDTDFIEMTFGRFLTRQELSENPLTKELGIPIPSRERERYIDLSDDRAWRFVAVFYANSNGSIVIASRQRNQP